MATSHDPRDRGLLELAGRVHDDVRVAGRDRGPLVGLPVEEIFVQLSDHVLCREPSLMVV